MVCTRAATTSGTGGFFFLPNYSGGTNMRGFVLAGIALSLAMGVSAYAESGGKDKKKSQCSKSSECKSAHHKHDGGKRGKHHSHRNDGDKRSQMHREWHNRHAEARKKFMEKYDTNKDGKLDDKEKAAVHKEWSARRDAWRKEIMKKYDKNEDGELDEKEKAAMRKAYEDRMKKMREEWPERVVDHVLKHQDKNEDGKLNADEVSERGRARFKEMDVNKDGYLDKDEIGKEMKARAQRMRAEWERRRQAHQKRSAEAKPAKRDVGEIIKNLMEGDKNDDGKLNADEASPRLRYSFGKIDANSDGYIDKAELEAFLKQK
jgi:Ca2+-binding EF-hand superfamily protein